MKSNEVELGVIYAIRPDMTPTALGTPVALVDTAPYELAVGNGASSFRNFVVTNTGQKFLCLVSVTGSINVRGLAVESMTIAMQAVTGQDVNEVPTPPGYALQLIDAADITTTWAAELERQKSAVKDIPVPVPVNDWAEKIMAMQERAGVDLVEAVGPANTVVKNEALMTIVEGYVAAMATPSETP